MVSNSTAAQIDRELLGEIYTSQETWNNLLVLCEKCGSRFVGTEDEVRARLFIRRRMKAYGLDRVRLEPFDYLGWRRAPRGPSFRIVAPERMDLPAISLPYCPATGARGIEARVLDVGDGLPADFERLHEQIPGTIVLATNHSPAYFSRWVHRAEKYGRAVAAGASGFVFVNHADGLLPETGCLRFNRHAEIPGISISKEHYAQIGRLASRRGLLRARIVTRDRSAPARAFNVTGEIRAGRPSNEFLIVGAHYDGHDISPGAGDNANGVCILLEAARNLARVRKHLRRSIRFVAFCGEEIGLVGAHADVARHRAELDRVRFMLNIDGVPAGSPKGLLFHGWDAMKPYVARLSRDMGYSIPFGSRIGTYSDFFPYFLAGLPTAGLANPLTPSRGRGFGHSAADTVDKIDPRDLREAADVITRVLLRVANDEGWPLRRRTAADIRRMLAEAGILEILRVEGVDVPEA